MFILRGIRCFFFVLVTLTITTVVCGGCSPRSTPQISSTSATNITPAFTPTTSSIFIPPIDPNTLTIYKIFEMKADDIHEQLFKHPRYSVEIPAIFPIGDEDLDPSIRKYGIANVDFNIRQQGLYGQWLRIRVEPHTWYNNANEKFIDFLNTKNSSSANITTKTVFISGIQAHYMELYSEVPAFPYPEHLVSLRVIDFDYAGLIWEISLHWYYHDSEPQQVQEFFNHIISTFKFLE
jgi:hypothetical protein